MFRRTISRIAVVAAKAKSALKSALVGYALAVLAPVLLGVVKGWIGG